VFDGGASTVTRAAGSPIATVTTTSNHNLITGNVVYALTGVVADSYYVTVTSPTSFTITTVATTALTAASITFQVATIRASGNVTSVAKVSATNFFVNLGIAMPDEFYSAVVSSNNMSTGAYILNMGVGTYNNTTAYTLTPQSFELSSGAGTYKIITAQVFR
jgi:hypothetical protein